MSAQRPGKDDSSLALVLVTAPRVRASLLAKELLEERLIACANISRVDSLYRWRGELEKDEEALLILKTTTGRLAELEERVLELHPYDVPEFVALPASRAARKYLDWVRTETAG